MMPTHFYVNKALNKRIISDFANSRFISSTYTGEPYWTSSNLPSLGRPHALTYSPEAQKYFAVDTDNNQLISFTSFDVNLKDDIQRYSEVNGTPIGKRPHDIAYNPIDKNVYVVMSDGVLRFTANSDGILDSDFISRSTIATAIRKNQPNETVKVGYVRALTIVAVSYTHLTLPTTPYV